MNRLGRAAPACLQFDGDGDASVGKSSALKTTIVGTAALLESTLVGVRSCGKDTAWKAMLRFPPPDMIVTRRVVNS